MAKKHLQEKIDALVKENESLRRVCNQQERDSILRKDQFNLKEHFILTSLIDAANKNVLRPKSGYRHDEILKVFAAYLKMIGGRLAYETLHANLPLVLPSSSTVNKYIYKKRPFVIEGKLRLADLKDYLRERDLPLRVSLSEDATRIQATVCYDRHTNQLIGFALPLDENGMPMPFSFLARHAKEIKGHMRNTDNVMSSNVYVQMAQLISRIHPPFCLMSFLTDNTFQAETILSRWNYTKQQLKDIGITVDNFASDGDPRHVKVMKLKSEIGVTDLTFFNCEWYSCGCSNRHNIHSRYSPCWYEVSQPCTQNLKNHSDRTKSNFCAFDIFNENSLERQTLANTV